MVIVYVLVAPTSNKKVDEKEKRFERGEMSQEEREKYINKRIKSAEERYRHGDLPLFALEAIKKSIPDTPLC